MTVACMTLSSSGYCRLEPANGKFIGRNSLEPASAGRSAPTVLRHVPEIKNSCSYVQREGNPGRRNGHKKPFVNRALALPAGGISSTPRGRFERRPAVTEQQKGATWPL